MSPRPLSAALIVALVTGGALAAPLTTAPATRPTTNAAAVTAAAERTARVQELTAEFNGHPDAGKFTWDQVLRLDFEGPALIPRSSFPQTDQLESFTIDGVDGLLTGWFRLNKARQPLLLRIDRLRLIEGGTAYVRTSLNTVPGHTMISIERESAAGALTVQFLDDRQFPDALGPHPDGEARLFVTESDLEDRPQANVRLIAADLRSLAHDHPHDVDAYLRPALHDLNQEQLLNPSLELARQVLAPAGGNSPPVPQALTPEMEKWLKQLDADDAPRRREAAAALKKMGEPAARALAALDRDKLTPEQQTQVVQIIGVIKPVSDEDVTALAQDSRFLTDCLWLPDPELRRAAKGKLESAFGQAVNFDPDAPYEQRAAQILPLRLR